MSMNVNDGNTKNLKIILFLWRMSMRYVYYSLTCIKRSLSGISSCRKSLADLNITFIVTKFELNSYTHLSTHSK